MVTQAMTLSLKCNLLSYLKYGLEEKKVAFSHFYTQVNMKKNVNKSAANINLLFAAFKSSFVLQMKLI